MSASTYGTVDWTAWADDGRLDEIRALARAERERRAERESAARAGEPDPCQCLGRLRDPFGCVADRLDGEDLCTECLAAEREAAEDR